MDQKVNHLFQFFKSSQVVSLTDEARLTSPHHKLKYVEDCRILVAGVGGLGCEILKNLVLEGFKYIEIVDGDTIELSNLNRQFLFAEKDIGESKVEVAAAFLNRRFAGVGVSVVPHFKRIEEFDLSFFAKFNLIFGGLDSVEARRWLNSALCQNVIWDEKTGQPQASSIKPWLDGGSEGFRGQARVIIPTITACYECTLDTLPPKPSYPFCTIAGRPRVPEHCIERALLIEWPKAYPQKQFNRDVEEDIQWIFRTAQTIAQNNGIQGLTRDFLDLVVKDIIPSVGTTNAIIGACLVSEGLKLVTGMAPVMDNFGAFNGEIGASLSTFRIDPLKDCPVCGIKRKTVRVSENATLQAFFDLLEKKYMITDPSAFTFEGILYMQKPPELKAHHQSKLGLSWRSLIDIGLVTSTTCSIYVTSASLPRSYVFDVVFEG